MGFRKLVRERCHECGSWFASLPPSFFPSLNTESPTYSPQHSTEQWRSELTPQMSLGAVLYQAALVGLPASLVLHADPGAS